MVISSLIEFRDRLPEFRTPKNEKVVEYFVDCKIDVYDDEAKIPELKDIAASVNLPRPKVNEYVKDLYGKMKESLASRPFTVSKVNVEIYISRPWNERRKTKYGYPDFSDVDERTTTVKCNLPYVPRIGEEIELIFFDRDHNHTRGYVYNVQHTISGATQNITVFVHPSGNYYHHWMTLKEEYERWQSWRANLESSIERERRQQQSKKG